MRSGTRSQCRLASVSVLVYLTLQPRTFSRSGSIRQSDLSTFYNAKRPRLSGSALECYNVREIVGIQRKDMIAERETADSDSDCTAETTSSDQSVPDYTQ